MGSSKLIGTNPDQVPTNADLGSLAFQDSKSVNIEGGVVVADHKVDTAISTVEPTLNLNFAKTKTLDSRITFSRASTATYYDGRTVAKAEENLLLQSQDFDNAAWGKDNATVVANISVAPDGTLTADAIIRSGTSLSNVSQAATRAVDTYTVSVYAKAGTQNYLAVQVLTNGTTKGSFITFNLTNGAIGTEQSLTALVGLTASASSVGNGWYRCVVTYTSLGGLNNILFNPANAANTRNGDDAGTIYLWGAQLEQRASATAYTPTTSQPVATYIPALQTAPVNSARFDHDPITGESKGFLIEEQRTNLLTYSEQFDNAVWNRAASIVTPNAAIAPDGTLTADKCVNTSGNVGYLIQSYNFVSGTPYTYSCYVNSAGRTSFVLLAQSAIFSDAINRFGTYDLSAVTASATGSGTVASITSVGNGWYRCSLNFAATASASSGVQMRTVTSGDGWSGFNIWGAQLETGSFPTSYIPTTTSQVTRLADLASMTGSNFSSWYRADEGTLYGEAASVATGAVAVIDDGSNNNRYHTEIATNYRPNFAAVASGTVYADLYSSSQAQGSAIKLSVCYKVNDFAISANGVYVSTDTSGALPASINTLRFGVYATAVKYLNGTIKRIAYYPKRLSNAELQEMTS